MLKRATVFFAMLCAGGIAAGQTPGFPTELKQSLDLSDSQISRILSVNRDYTDLANNKNRRTYDLYREISEESAKNPVDPLELGKRYAEQEAIRRELGEALARLRVRNREVLNAAQLMKLKTLEDIYKIQPIASEAVCENILAGPASPNLRWVDSIVFRITPVARLTPLALFTPFPPNYESVYGLQSIFPTALRQYLDLSDAQINGIVTLNLAYSDFVYRKRVRVEQIQLEIRDETAKDPLDPMELGIRYAEFQAFCEYLMDPSSFGADDRGYSPYRFPSCDYR